MNIENMDFDPANNTEHLKALKSIIDALGPPKKEYRKMLSYDGLPEEFKKVESVVIPSPSEFLTMFSLPKDCQSLALAHMAKTIAELFGNDKEINKNLVSLNSLYLYEAFKKDFKLKKNIDFIKEWKKKAVRYKNSSEIKEQFFGVNILIQMILRTVPTSTDS